MDDVSDMFSKDMMSMTDRYRMGVTSVAEREQTKKRTDFKYILEITMNE